MDEEDLTARAKLFHSLGALMGNAQPPSVKALRETAEEASSCRVEEINERILKQMAYFWVTSKRRVTQGLWGSLFRTSEEPRCCFFQEAAGEISWLTDSWFHMKRQKHVRWSLHLQNTAKNLFSTKTQYGKYAINNRIWHIWKTNQTWGFSCSTPYVWTIAGPMTRTVFLNDSLI